MKSVKYLEDVKSRHALKNNAALAKHLELTEGAISLYMSGKRVMDEETCLAVALALEIEPHFVLLAAGIDRAEKTGQRSLWEVFSKRSATAASFALVMSVNLFLTPQNAEAAPRLALLDDARASSLYYVKSNFWSRTDSRILLWEQVEPANHPF